MYGLLAIPAGLLDFVPESYDMPSASLKALYISCVKHVMMGIAARTALVLSIPDYSGRFSSAFVLGFFGFGNTASLLDTLPHSG
jgi:hypothetical protein